MHPVESSSGAGPRPAAATVALLCVLALVAAACSRSGGTAASTTTSGGSTATTAAATTSAAVFGTMTKPVCGPKPAGETNVGGQRGLTPTQIEVGAISDPGFSGAPGLNQELFDTSTVFIKWCNSLGGINGRLLKDDQLDAAVLNYPPQIATGCNQDFALVGGGGVLDGSGQKARLNCLLPDYAGYLVSPEARGSDLSVQVTPGPNNSLNFGIARYLAQKYPDAANKVGYLTGNVSQTVTTKSQYEEAGLKQGFGKAVYDAQYNSLGESTWTPIAQAIKSSGVKGLFFVGEPSDFGRLIAALSSINYKLDWLSASANQYDPKLLAGAGAALDQEPVYVALGTTPFERTNVKAISQYESIYQQFLPSSTRNKAALGLNSFSAWLLFAQSVKSCGGNPTPKCVFAAAKTVKTWDGGGLQAPSNPSNGNEASPCQAIVKASPTGWTIVNWPPQTGGYNCSSANVVALTGNYGTGVKLSDVGKSMSDLP